MKKRKNKLTDDEYPNAVRTLVLIDNQASFYALTYPYEIIEHFEEAKKIIEIDKKFPDPKYRLPENTNIIEYELESLEKEAKYILKNKGYPTDLDELSQIDNPATTQYFKMDMQSSSAKQVLLSAKMLRDYIKNNMTEKAVEETIYLISSAIKMVVWNLIKEGEERKIARQKGLYSSKFLKKKIGVLSAIEKTKREDPRASAGKIWNVIKSRGKKESPFIVGAIIEIKDRFGKKRIEKKHYNIYIENEKLYQIDGDEKKQITRRAFERYLTYWKDWKDIKLKRHT